MCPAIKPFDGLEDFALVLLTGFETAVKDPLRFEGMEETIRRRVVPAETTRRVTLPMLPSGERDEGSHRPGGGLARPLGSLGEERSEPAGVLCPSWPELCRLWLLGESGPRVTDGSDAGVCAVVVKPPEVAAWPGIMVPGSAVGRTGIEIHLAHGRSVVVGPDFDEAVLARMIRVWNVYRADHGTAADFRGGGAEGLPASKLLAQLLVSIYKS